MNRLGLRARVTALFAGGALLLSAALAITTYEFTRYHLIAEQERGTVRAAYFDAAVVRQGIAGPGVDVVGVLRSLDTGSTREALLRRDGEWFARSADDGLTKSMPSGLLDRVQEGTPQIERVRVPGGTAVVVGVPLERVDGDLFEVQSLSETASTLRTLELTLVAVATVATLAAAALGRWAAARALLPLRAMSVAARRISEGDLTARIEAPKDPDLRSLTGSFNAMVGEVTERIDREQRFAADVSHELRSPLQTLTSAATVLHNRSAQLDDRTGIAVELVVEEAERFTALVQGLLELARDEVPAVLSLTDVAALLAALCQRKAVAVALLDVAPDVGSWQLDRRRIERVLDNLVDNATKHGGGVVRLGVFHDEGALCFEVDDAGPGVPIEERTLIFGRFGRGRAANARDGADGTGLGLSLAARHTAAHDGAITVHDRPGGGARFTVHIPPGAQATQ